MIRKFAAVPGVRVVPTLILATILVGATTVQAQQTPAQQAPAQPPAQQPSTQAPPDNPQSGQEATPGEIGVARKPKVKQYKDWVFNVGGGAGLPDGTTRTFVRGGGGIAAAGVARNYSPYFGFRLDFQYDNLPLRDSALKLAQAPGATSQVYSVTLDPIINLPVSNEWAGYILFGPSFYHRSGKLDSSTAIPGSACNSFFQWWGPCFDASLPLNGNFLHSAQNEFGENFGFGVARKITPKVELYGEFRILHGSRNRSSTDLRPITIGVRW
jgi:hypothetical protein